MARLFEERDWLLFNQPSQSPITNVHNACVFPSSHLVCLCRAQANRVRHPNWMEEEVAVPDLVEDDDAVTARVTTVKSLAVVAEVNYEEGTV